MRLSLCKGSVQTTDSEAAQCIREINNNADSKDCIYLENITAYSDSSCLQIIDMQAFQEY